MGIGFIPRLFCIHLAFCLRLFFFHYFRSRFRIWTLGITCGLQANTSVFFLHIQRIICSNTFCEVSMFFFSVHFPRYSLQSQKIEKKANSEKKKHGDSCDSCVCLLTEKCKSAKYTIYTQNKMYIKMAYEYFRLILWI